MKIKTSIIIGVPMLIIAIGFITFAISHPELSFPWNQRITFMLYGAYIWFMFRFLIDILVLRKNKEKEDKSILRAVIFLVMALGFFLMEVTGDTVNVHTILRGYVVAGACDVAIENLHKDKKVKIYFIHEYGVFR